MNTPYDPLTVAVAGYGLAGSSPQWPSAPLDANGWRRLSDMAARQRIIGLLAAAVAGGALPVTESQHAEVAERHRQTMAGVLHLEAGLLEAARVLDDAAIPWRVLKGSAAAHLDYKDPALRAFGDVDLLVPGAFILRAVEALATIGATRRRPALGRRFDERFAKSVELVDDLGAEIDVHRTLALEPFGLRIDEADLFATPEPFALGTRKLLALGAEQRLVHACYHASLGNFPVRLVPLRDLAQLGSREGLDIERVVTLAERWWARAVVADATTRAWTLFGLPAEAPLALWALDYQPSRAELHALGAFQRRRRRQADRTIATLRTLPGIRLRAAYLRTMLRPDQAYLDSRGLGPAAWLARGRAALAHRGRR